MESINFLTLEGLAPISKEKKKELREDKQMQKKIKDFKNDQKIQNFKNIKI